MKQFNHKTIIPCKYRLNYSQSFLFFIGVREIASLSCKLLNEECPNLF